MGYVCDCRLDGRGAILSSTRQTTVSHVHPSSKKPFSDINTIKLFDRTTDHDYHGICRDCECFGADYRVRRTQQTRCSRQASAQGWTSTYGIYSMSGGGLYHLHKYSSWSYLHLKQFHLHEVSLNSGHGRDSFI